MHAQDLIRLAARHTVARMLERERPDLLAITGDLWHDNEHRCE